MLNAFDNGLKNWANWYEKRNEVLRKNKHVNLNRSLAYKDC